MDLRWRLVVVLGAGAGIGAEVAERLARQGAGVIAVDRDTVAAEATATSLVPSRVSAWSLGVDVALAEDRQVLLARCRDLGGADAVVNPVGSWPEIGADFLGGLELRRGRRDDAAVVDVVPPGQATPWCLAAEQRARLMVVERAPGEPDDCSATARAVVDLLIRGHAGERRTPTR